MLPSTQDADEDPITSGARLAVDEVRRDAGRGLRWSLLGTILLKFGNLAMNLVLARLLLPADFGIYAIAFGAVAFLMMVKDIGLIAAAMQWRGDFGKMAPTATTLVFTSCALIFGAFWFAARPFAEFSGSGAATPVVRLAAAVILVEGVTAIRGAYLLRTFQQNRVVTASLSGMTVQMAVSISLAVAGAGAMGLAGGQVAGAVVMGTMVMFAAKVPFRFGLDRALAGKLLRFGMPLAASLGVEAVLLNADYVVIGREVGTSALGFYLLAFMVSSWIPGVVINVMRWVAIPSFARLIHDEGALSIGVRQAIVLLGTLMVPITVLFTVLAPALVAFLYGDKWAPVAEVLSLLAVLSVVRVLTSLVTDVLTSAAKTHIALWMNVGWALTLVPALVLGARAGGIRGAAIAHVIVGLVVALPLAIFALRRVGVDLAPIPRELLRPVLAGGLAWIVCTVALEATVASPLVQLLVAGPACLLAYGAAVVPREQLMRWGARVWTAGSVSDSDG